LRRLYHYTLAFIGLVVAFVGVGTLFSFLIDQLTLGLTVSGRVRERLVSSISSLIVGLPLWLINWRPMQAEALSPGEVGDHARRSVLRKTYLYLALFASVIGGMATAVGLVYNVLRVVLTGDSANDFVNNILNLTQLLFLFGVVLMYHLNVLRTDGAATADSLADKQNEYSVLIVDSGDGFVESLRAALARFAPRAPVTVAPPLARPEGNFNALVLRGSLAVDAPEWIRSFDGDRVVVQDEALDIFWSSDAAQAAQFVQKLAEGEQVQKQKPGRSPWTVAVYVFAALFAIQLLFILMALGISLIG
jgi:hypothetical protein